MYANQSSRRSRYRALGLAQNFSRLDAFRKERIASRPNNKPSTPSTPTCRNRASDIVHSPLKFFPTRKKVTTLFSLFPSHSWRSHGRTTEGFPIGPSPWAAISAIATTTFISIQRIESSCLYHRSSSPSYLCYFLQPPARVVTISTLIPRPLVRHTRIHLST